MNSTMALQVIVDIFLGNRRQWLDNVSFNAQAEHKTALKRDVILASA
ncbi:hypothetical protein [Thioflexithrix psekupsensis]|nr:hypothetical protein [Thioflexithrix psekupsensis]